MAINALASMGILTNDDSLIDAALSELISLPLDLRHRRDLRRDFAYILRQHHLGQVSDYSPRRSRFIRTFFIGQRHSCAERSTESRTCRARA